ncbi:MAG: alkaline phosphatase family protein [Mycoplasmoidaceae bacterium]|nr:alkaline phosphatase family protein [Mycoplasmoidaceae bacterium]
MVTYDGIDSDIIIYPPQEVTNPLGEVVAKAGLSQLRIAETEKYAHVTYFLDGGKEKNYPNEEKIVIPSPKVATYDLKPEMSANEITEHLLANMDQFDFFVCNFANCDMVGHTGKMEPTIKAIETVDTCLGQIVQYARQNGITLFITSDHGNCDKVLDDEGKPFTAHTTTPVFFICTDPYIRFKEGMFSLGNIAPTILKYLEVDIPKEMEKQPLY